MRCCVIRRAAGPALAGVALLVGLAVLVPLRGAPEVFGAVFAVFTNVMTVATIAIMIVLARSAPKGSGIPSVWARFAVVVALADVSGAALGIAGTVVPAIPGLAVAFVLRLAMTALFVWTVLAVPSSTKGGQGAGLLDFVTVAAGSAGVVWFVVSGPVVDDAGAPAIIASLIPVLHVVACYTALVTRFRGPHRALAQPVAWLAVASGLPAGYDSYGAASIATGNPVPIVAPVLFVSVLASTSLYLAAALSGVGARRATGFAAQYRSEGLSLATPVIALLVVQALLLTASSHEYDLFPWVGLVAASALTTTTVGIRQALALRENRRLVGTDALTGLANRRRLTFHLDHVLAAARPGSRSVSVLLCDLDGFKQINDAYGHETGDRVLRAFAAILHRSCATDDLAARLGGDEFAVVMAPGSGESAAVHLAQRILEQCAGPVPVGETLIRPRVSIGIAVGDGSVDSDALLNNADLAMYEAKRHRGEGWHLFDGSRTRDSSSAGLLDDLETALRSDQLSLVYQPVVDMRGGGRLLGVEALLRWVHPTRGPLSPTVFVPVAERGGLAQELGEWVLEAACRQMAQWRAAHPNHPLDLAVNLSPSQLDHEGFVDRVDRILHRTGMDPRHLVLEITESALVDDLRSVPVLQALRSRGIRIALDDFGTGYSSLRYLTRLPVDTLKLDKCFVADLAESGGGAGAAVAEAVARLASALGFDTVAEGIEDEGQAERLVGMGYRVAQGFHYAVPLSPGAVSDLMAAARATVPPQRVAEALHQASDA